MIKNYFTENATFSVPVLLVHFKESFLSKNLFDRAPARFSRKSTLRALPNKSLHARSGNKVERLEYTVRVGSLEGCDAVVKQMERYDVDMCTGVMLDSCDQRDMCTGVMRIEVGQPKRAPTHNGR